MVLLESIRAAIGMKMREQALANQMAQARTIQHSLLPARLAVPAGFDIAALSHPAEEVGGDVYDVQEVEEGVVGLMLADASGHGLPAALQARDVVIGMRMGQAEDEKINATVARLNDEQDPVVCWTGDGGTYDIGMATLSAAAERNEDIIYICYDNEIYGNTGGQRSSATPAGARTSTTPLGKADEKKDVMSIMAAHRIPYAATLSMSIRSDPFRSRLPTARSPSGSSTPSTWTTNACPPSCIWAYTP